MTLIQRSTDSTRCGVGFGRRPFPCDMVAGCWGAGDLQVDVEDDEIVVTKPGTRDPLAYRRSIDQPRLVMTRSWMGPTTHCAGDKRVSRPSFSGRSSASCPRAPAGSGDGKQASA